jgi:glycerate dehydrogenase
VSALAESIGMEVLVAERKLSSVTREGRASFREVLRQSDVLTLHCPLNRETRDLIGAEEFQMMKKNAILINTARGGLVREEALVEALQTGLIAGAAFDVLGEEPPRQGNILLDQNLPNLIVTPHIAWASMEAMQTLADQLIETIEAIVRGDPRNLVF